MNIEYDKNSLELVCMQRTQMNNLHVSNTLLLSQLNE